MKIIIIVVCLIACAPRPLSPRDERIAAAAFFTERCAASRLDKWNIRGAASGADCDVLLVDTSTVLQDSLVEAMHYGSGSYAVVDGGVRRFSREHAFRGVAYRDRTGRVWRYGDLSQTEAEELRPCR